MDKFRNRVAVRLSNNERDCFKWTSKSFHIAQKGFLNDLVAIHKIKTALILKNYQNLYTRIK